MSAIAVVGGLYHERCVWPDWDRVFGSGGRAAAAVVGHVDAISFRTYATDQMAESFRPQAAADGIAFEPAISGVEISFDYLHSLATPVISPPPSKIPTKQPLDVASDVVLRFGFMEGTARVTAERCVYDPQSAFAPEPFQANGSRAKMLAIVANRGEVVALGGSSDPELAAANLVRQGAAVVVVKSGVRGAFVVDGQGITHVTPHRSDRVWTIGSGDVFAGMFAARWGVHQDNPVDAAEIASLAVAAYANTMGLPIPAVGDLRARAAPVGSRGGQAYLAGPFFTVGQRWLIDEARRGLQELGLKVFSPVHDVGRGDAQMVAPADIAALEQCDVVFAILDGLDSGTLFEVGYARAKGKPVYALAQAVSIEDLKMIEGSDCRVYDDFVTALHHTAWRA